MNTIPTKKHREHKPKNKHFSGDESFPNDTELQIFQVNVTESKYADIAKNQRVLSLNPTSIKFLVHMARFMLKIKSKVSKPEV